jgi:hypothetical protein
VAAWESAPVVGNTPAWQAAPVAAGSGQGDHGYALAPPEDKPKVPDMSGGYVSSSGDYVPAAAIPGTQPSATAPPVIAPNVQAAPPQSGHFPTIAEARSAMAPPPGYVTSSVLPIATKEVSPGQGDPSAGIKWDWGPIRTVVNPLLDLLEGTGQATSVGGPNAPLAGKVSPEATLAMLGIAAGNPNPFAPRTSLLRPGDLRFGSEPVPPGLAAREAPLPPDFQQSPLGPDVTARVIATPPTEPVPQKPGTPTPFHPAPTDVQTSPTGIPVTRPEVPQPPPGAAAPTQSQPGAAPEPQAGAAGAQVTPGAELGITPKEEAAYRSTAEGNKLLEPQEPGVRDTTQYLPGEKFNEAEASQDVQIARELKSLRQQTPELDAALTADETHNNTLRANAINNALPGQVQIQAATKARQDAMVAAEPKVFANAGDADVQPVVQTIQDVLSDPKNKQNTQLQQYVKPLIDRLQNADGTPKIVDPRELWSFRQDVQHLTSGAAHASDPNLSRVSGVLGGVLDSIDNQIEAAAPGYKAQLRDDYRTRSQQIDAMDALNAERFKLFDSQNKPNYNSVQNLMRRIIDARQANDPYDPFTHVTQDTLDQLWNIRDSMRRSAAADRLAQPKGSPTSQNLGDAMRAAGRTAMQTSAPGVGAALGSVLIPIPGAGAAIGVGAGTLINHLFSERAMTQRLKRGMELRNGLGTGAAP